MLGTEHVLIIKVRLGNKVAILVQAGILGPDCQIALLRYIILDLIPV